MHTYVLDLHEIDKSRLEMVGGKGANLGELSRMEGIQVPDGFCITTAAYKEIIGNNDTLNALLDQLALLAADNRKGIGEIAATIRKEIEGIAIPDSIVTEITRHLNKSGESQSYAVRSSATAEDLPGASFAGQQDSYLNIMGQEAILQHISRCWASLFTDRAIIYRIQQGFDHHRVSIAVVVQEMVFPDASGILFTADPVSSHRKVVSIDAGYGLGEALVSGLVNADNYKARDGKVIDKKISNKKLAVHPVEDGGTSVRQLEVGRQNTQVLSDEQILELERIGRRIESYFGVPQDLEWCLANNIFYIVQSRPITTLYPIPETNDQEYHVYVSVGHQQMMTDAMKPLGLSFYQLTTRAPMRVAGGRLFVDISTHLSSPQGRETLLNTLGKSDPLIKDALISMMERKVLEGHERSKDAQGSLPTGVQANFENDPAIVGVLINKNEASVETLKQTIRTKSGVALFDFIQHDLQELKQLLMDPQSIGVIYAAINASAWINEKMQDWLGEKNVADKLSQSVSNNITSEMGLELLDLADVIRPYPEVIDCLQQMKGERLPEALIGLPGGAVVWNAFNAYIQKYGMRCSGEIDISKMRWAENPMILIPMLLNNIKNFEPGEAARKFEQGRKEALKKEQELLHQLGQLPDGDEKARETKRMIDLIRNFSGYREYPKYGMVNRYFVYKLALLKEAELLVQAGVIPLKEDLFYLSFEECREVVRTQRLEYRLISQRKEEFKLFEKLTPPRVITSDGEIIRGEYKKEQIPVNALAGLPVSTGVIEGRARVILNMDDAELEEGDILVTSFTDPSWTPLFVSIKALVTEVGGLMTHGAVIAREYGLPAVVGVENATRLIPDGSRIRVHGSEGYVEILED